MEATSWGIEFLEEANRCITNSLWRDVAIHRRLLEAASLKEFACFSKLWTVDVESQPVKA